jgi:hypothetical protein
MTATAEKTTAEVEAETGLREINIPFPGFYYSLYSDAIDHAEEMDAEYAAEREIESAREAIMAREAAQFTFPFANRKAIEIDESKFVTASEFAELFFNHCDYHKVYDKVAEFYAEAFGIWAGRELGLTSEFKLSIMVSPREYNFTTDRLFALVSEADIQTMWQRSVEDEHESLARGIKERFTSYDGFCSFYSNDIDTWLEKPLSAWDYNELGTLLLALIDLCGFKRDEMEMELYELTFSGNGEECDARDAGMDWPAYEAALEKLRKEKAAP